MLNGPAVGLTLGVAQVLANPTATFSTPATAIQLQNASPFILEVIANGAQSVIQSFTAQTIELPASGENITVIPTSGPAGTQGNLTPVWLQPNEAAAMTDGQLTGAAQYAVGSGSTVVGPYFPVVNNSGLVAVIATPPPTTRTLIIYAASSTPITKVVVGGTPTGFTYYNKAPYLLPAGSSNSCLVVVPVSALIDTSFLIQVFAAVNANAPIVFTVVADTAEYREDVFYNGPVQVASGNNAGQLLAGPARLLAITLSATTDTFVTNGAGKAFIYARAGTETEMTFPPNSILGQGDIVNLAAAANNCGVTFAYP
jgi:hypothetical protein